MNATTTPESDVARTRQKPVEPDRIYRCGRCRQLWNYSNDARECSTGCNGIQPTDKLIAG